jgi:tRNA dimethylallyltransferase
MNNVIVIVGPTASGKTALSIKLAKEINGSIISADSMQVYKYMDIGTAKPTKEEMSGVDHYLIDEISPDQEFSVAKFKEKALCYIEKIIDNGKIPIVVGGTGLYINSLIYNIEFSKTQVDWEYREELKNNVLKNGEGYIYNQLMEVDKQSAEKINPNDTKRVIRALEIYKTTGKTMTFHNEKSRLYPSKYSFKLFGLNMQRQSLYKRIEERVDNMIKQGLLEEVKKIEELGYDEKRIPMQALGYKEIIKYLKGENTLEESIEIIKRDSRRYAKRQLTWFRRIENIKWFQSDEEDYEEIIKKIKVCLETD